MKFTIDRDAFSEILSRVQGVCAQKSTLPILASCLISAQKDGTITVHGTDLEVSIATSCPAQVETTGRVALTARRLYETVKAAPPGSVTLEAEANHWAVLDAGRVHARIAGSHPEEFPQIPPVADNLPVSMPADALLDMIDKTYFSISTDEARASFTGAYLCATEHGTLLMVSTDGHRLSKIELDDEAINLKDAPEALRQGIVVPRKALAELKRALTDPSVQITLGVEGDDLLVSSDTTSLAVRLIPGRFPDFTQVIPEVLDHRVVIQRDMFMSAVKRAGFYSAKTGNTRLTLSEGTVELYTVDPEAGELNEPIPCEYSGSGVTAGFNYRYLLDVLNNIEGPDVIMELIDTESPTVVRDSARDDVLYIVMPMQL